MDVLDRRSRDGFGQSRDGEFLAFRRAHRLTRGTLRARWFRSSLRVSVVVVTLLALGAGPTVGQDAPAGESLNPLPSPASTSDSVLPGADLSQGQISVDQVRQALGDQDQQEPAVPEPQAPVAEAGPSATERLLSGQMPADVPGGLRQFGYDVFNRPVSTFAPVTSVPVGPDYVLGPGDRFTLTMWGRVDLQHTLQVDQNGQIVLPEVGALKIWGMKFGELDDYLQHELSRKYTDFKMSITMDRLRAIRIFVVGEASAPGSYTISSLSTAINALFAAGGPSKNGSLRKIRLSRDGADPAEIDLYKFLLGGDKSTDLRLQDGDTIFIPLIGPVVGVAGNVKRAAIYEMDRPTTLQDALDLAGGVTFAGWLQRIQVERVENHQRRIVVDLDLSQETTANEQEESLGVVMQDGDIVRVFSVTPGEQNIVRLTGHVVRPGKYEWKSGMRLKEILSSYDALQPQANLNQGEIERLVPPDLHPTTIPFDPGKLLAGDESANMALAQYDTIRVFRWDERRAQAVNISGMVFDPNQYRLTSGMRVSDLINRAGGLQKNAYLRMAELTRRDVTQDGMTVQEIDVDLEKALAGDPEHDLALQDYDYMVVRPVPELEFGRIAEIRGEVRFPGVYPSRKGETLSSLIERAGGYTARAYLKGAVFTRESAREVQRQRLYQMIRQLEESVLASAEETTSGALDAETAQSQQMALRTKQELLKRLQLAEVTGRVVVKLAPFEEFKGSKYDMELENGDRLVIPQTPGVVHAIGEVFNPTSLLYEEGQTVGYYLRRVGGMTKEADKKQVSVVKADGSVISTEQGNRGRLVFWDSEYNTWFFGGFMSMEMEPGDTIVVPRKLDRFLWIRTTKDITQIVFQIAVAAGVVFAI